MLVVGGVKKGSTMCHNVLVIFIIKMQNFEGILFLNSSVYLIFVDESK